ncbi:MAG: glycosyltransferase [Lachnospiraceae bacterium]|nr:glycosyltransferase [Lachnospiraceae bacterium]
MRILFYDMGSYLYNDILDTLQTMGHYVRTVYYHFDNRCKDDFFYDRFQKKLASEPFDMIFSVNFYPVVAIVANEAKIPYVSWSCDSPLAEELEHYFPLETNRIFLFDREEVTRYQKQGITTVFHMPLAVNAERISAIRFSEGYRKLGGEVAFVGRLYETSLEPLLLPMDEYTKGYLQSAIDVQLEIYGTDLITPMLTQELMDRINTSFREKGFSTILTKKGLAYALEKQITYAERVTLLDTLGDLFETKFYSDHPYPFSSHVKYMGPVKYHTEMPAVFRYSKINLCPTLRSILSGIPLRSLDIMACGGALMSNYQPELAENFIDGEEVILYSSLEEAVEKASYYLSHDTERIALAEKGREKILKEYSYKNRLSDILSVVPI